MKVTKEVSAGNTDSGLPACPVETCLLIMDGKWKPLIVRELLGGKKRFSQLQRGINGVSQKVLTANLKDMISRDLVIRTAYPEVPPRVEYELTELGQSLSIVIDAMWTWGENYQHKHHAR